MCCWYLIKAVIVNFTLNILQSMSSANPKQSGIIYRDPDDKFTISVQIIRNNNKKVKIQPPKRARQLATKSTIVDEFKSVPDYTYRLHGRYTYKYLRSLNIDASNRHGACWSCGPRYHNWLRVLIFAMNEAIKKMDETKEIIRYSCGQNDDLWDQCFGV